MENMGELEKKAKKYGDSFGILPHQKEFKKKWKMIDNKLKKFDKLMPDCRPRCVGVLSAQAILGDLY